MKNKDFEQTQSQRDKSEGYETIATDMPSDRFAQDKQIVKPDELGVTSKSVPKNVTNNATSAAVAIKAKTKVKPDTSVDDLGGKQVGGVPLAVEPSLRNAAGVRTQSVADDMSKTPYVPGGYRPATRYGKKRSEDLFELDNTAIEQVVPVVEDVPDLKGSPDSEVGYNGRQQFKQTRQKKNFTYVNADDETMSKLPQQLLNDASVDFVHESVDVYTTGQVINPITDNGGYDNLDTTADYPTYDGTNHLFGDDIMHRGNYQPTSLNITVTDGHITNVSISENKYVAVANEVERDEANMNWQTDANNIAETMIKIQKDMGRETTDKWTPLAYVIDQPYQYNMLLHDIEATTGAIMSTAYRSAVSSLAFQRNITRKDGIGPQRNAIKMILEGYAGIMANNNAQGTITDLEFDHMIFNSRAYRRGSVAGLIHMFDSTAKYQTKADLLGLQRSLGLHLSQADNNIQPLRCKKSFIKALDKAHMFSTIDGQYNPYLPIYSTKYIKLINPLSLNKFLIGWKNPINLSNEEKKDPRRDASTGTYAPYMYSYDDLRNTYTTRVQHPLIEGLLKWLLTHEGAFVSRFGEGVTTIPFRFDMESPSLLSFMLCSAAQDIAFERNICFRDILFAGEQSTYIWDDLTSVKELDPLYSTQLKIGKYDEPLTMGKLAPDTALRIMFSDHMQLSDHDRGLVQYFAPFYFNEQAYKQNANGNYDTRSGFRNPDAPFSFSFPSIRDGVRHEYIDLIKGMDPKDVMLAIDRKLSILPFTTSRVVRDSNGSTLYTEYVPMLDEDTMNNKVFLSTVRYDDNSDGRLVVRYDLNAGSNYNLDPHGMYCIPKEIGYIEDDYNGYNIISSVSYRNGDVVTEGVIEDMMDTDSSGINTEYYNGAKAVYVSSYRVEADSYRNGSIDRSAALTNTFYRFFASPTAEAINRAFINETGLVLTRSFNDALGDDVTGIYEIKTNTPAEYVIDSTVRTDAAYAWTMLQRFYMPMNPFANAFTVVETNHNYDPFEVAYWFGVCGFLAADYTQHVLTRLSERDQLGMNYTEDTNIKDSLIFR